MLWIPCLFKSRRGAGDERRSSRSAAVPPAECFRLLFRLFELAIYSLYYSYNEYIKIINCYNSDIMNIYTE